MTQLEFEWGEPIPADGTKPEWLAVGELPMQYQTSGPSEDWFDMKWGWGFACVGKAFRLRADHPYYVANAAGYNYWPGGDNEPVDWNGHTVLFRDGSTSAVHGFTGENIIWTHDGTWDDVIGYRKKAKAPPVMIDHSGPNMALGPNDPPGWAVVRAWNEVGGLVTPRSAILALARYIEKHEAAPVDPDVLAVRDIISSYFAGEDAARVAEALYEGEYDEFNGFVAALTVYRRIKANGGVVDVPSS